MIRAVGSRRWRFRSLGRDEAGAVAPCVRIPALGVLAVVVACGAGAPEGEGPAPRDAAEAVFPDDYERDVRPFPVRGREGTPYEHPFLGGFTNPRPQFVDINDSGHPDLFVQERGGEIMFFENVEGEDGERKLEWRTDDFQALEVGQWFRFVDPNNDGIHDLIAESPYNHIRYFRNVGTAREPTFEVVADTLRDVEGEAIFSDRQNIPNFADIDCDDLPDLFLGLLDGTITRYKAESFDSDGVPEFELVTHRFQGIQIITEFGSMRHGANSFTFRDHDGDGVVDLFWGDFFEPSLLLLENEGGCDDPRYSTEPELFPPNDPVSTSGYNAPEFADWSGNGVKDLFVGVVGGAHDANSTLSDNFLFYEAVGPYTYELRTERFLEGLDVGGESKVAVGDVTGNGAPDLLVGNRIDPRDRQTGTVHFYANVGGPTEPELEHRGILDLPEGYDPAPSLGDLTGDGQPDMVLGTWRGELLVFRNRGMEDGLPRFELREEWSTELPRGSTAIPTLVDLDGSGTKDLVAGGSDGRVYLFRNDGDGGAPSFQLREGAFPEEVRVSRRSAPELHDVNGNGLLDLVLGSEGEGLVTFLNEGSSDEPAFGAGETMELVVPRYAVPRFVDFRGDGRPSLLVGGRSGGVFHFGPG